MITRSNFLRTCIASMVLLLQATSGHAIAPVSVAADLPLTEPFLVSIEGYRGLDSDVAYNSVSDEYLAVWVFQTSIYGQRIDSRGFKLGGEFPISTDTSKGLYDPAVAYDTARNCYLVAWISRYSDTDWDLHARFISASGPDAGWPVFPIDLSNEFSQRPDIQFVSANNPQGFLVVWFNKNTEVPARNSILGRWVDAATGLPPEDVFTIKGGDGSDYQNPELSYNPAQNQHLLVYSKGPLYARDVFATRLTSQGIPVGDPLTMAATAANEDFPASAACSISDQYLVTWNASPQQYVRFVSGNGSMPNPSVYTIDSSVPGTVPEAGTSDVACRGGIQYFVVWERIYPGGGVGIASRLVYTDGNMDNLQGTVPPDPRRRDGPAVDAGTQNFLITWENWRPDQYPDIYGLVAGNTRPIAAFTIAPPSGYVTTQFQFDASASIDGQDPAASLQICWDWDNDGYAEDGCSTTRTASHQFSLPPNILIGFYSVALDVRDSTGAYDRVVKQLQLNNLPPIAAFTANPDPSESNSEVLFNASTSHDPEGDSNLQYRWDWDNDDEPDTVWSLSPTASAVFGTGYGQRTIRLEVKDSAWLSGSTTGHIMINDPPSAAIDVNPPTGDTYTLFNFSAIGSSDDTGPNNLECKWDWQDDGIFDTAWIDTQNTVYHMFPTSGVHTIRVLVRDSLGAVDYLAKQINVSEPSWYFLWVPLVLK